MNPERLEREIEARRRSDELYPLREVLQIDPLSNRIAECYIHGEILTLTECLMQIAFHCAKSRISHQNELIEWMKHNSTHFIIPTNPQTP